MAVQITVIQKKEFANQKEDSATRLSTEEKLETKDQPNSTSECLTCVHCDFKYTDHETLEKHLGSIHPEFSDRTNTVLYQKSAKLFHCHLCFFTNKVYSKVYDHVTTQHPKLNKIEKTFQTKERHEGVVSEVGKTVRATKRKLKESKVIKEEKPVKKRRGRRKRSEIASNTTEVQPPPVKPAETSSSTVEVQPVKRRPGRPKRKVEEPKNVDFNCEKCGTKFNTADELNIHNCQKKKKDANAALFEYSDSSGHYPIQQESTRKSSASNNPKEVVSRTKKRAALKGPRKRTIQKGSVEQTVSSNPKVVPLSNDLEGPSEEKDYAKSLQEHVKYVRGTFYCSFCRFHCKSKSSALYHVVRVHDKPYPYRCTECGRCFVMDKELKRHMSVHTGEAYYKCSKCDFESDYARAFKNHEKQCTSQQKDNCTENIEANKQQNTDQEKKLIRSELPSVQPNSSLKEVAQLHENSSLKIQSSDAGKMHSQLNATKSQTSKLQLPEPAVCVVAHQDSAPSSTDNVLSCFECGKTFEEQDMFQKHKLLHSVQKPPTCKLTHDDLPNLSDDTEKKHAEQKSFNCDSCNVQYQSKEDLQHHLNIHKPNTQGKTFNCETCSSKFEKQIDLRDHLKIHKQNISKTNQSNVTDNRMLYKCNYCSYSTYLFVNYIGHVRIAHTKNFPIHCSFCGDGFQLPAELKKHTCQQIQGANVISNQGDE